MKIKPNNQYDYFKNIILCEDGSLSVCSDTSDELLSNQTDILELINNSIDINNVKLMEIITEVSEINNNNLIGITNVLVEILNRINDIDNGDIITNNYNYNYNNDNKTINNNKNINVYKCGCNDNEDCDKCDIDIDKIHPPLKDGEEFGDKIRYETRMKCIDGKFLECRNVINPNRYYDNCFKSKSKYNKYGVRRSSCKIKREQEVNKYKY